MRALCQRGGEDTRGHLSEAVSVLAKEVGLDVPGLRDLIDLNWKLFDCVQTRKVQEGVVALALSIDGRQAAHDMGVEIPSPLEDAGSLRSHLAQGESGRQHIKSEELLESLPWGARRLGDAARVLDSSGDADVEHIQGGRFYIRLTPQGRLRGAPPVAAASSVRSVYLNAYPGLDRSLVWQAMNGPPDEDFFHIAFHNLGGRRAERRRTFSTLMQTLHAAPLQWLAPGKRTWKVNVPLLRGAFPGIAEYTWLGDGDIEIEPEFEDKEAPIFGRMRYDAVIELHITPDVAIPQLLPDAERTKIVVFHGPDNTTKHELIAWLRGPDVQADGRTVGEMPPSAEGSVNDRVQSMLDWADKAIAIVSPDPRSPSGALNVVEEIGRWLGAGRAADLAIVRHRECADLWSNLAGVVRVEFDARIRETFLPLARFLGVLGPRS